MWLQPAERQAAENPHPSGSNSVITVTFRYYLIKNVPEGLPDMPFPKTACSVHKSLLCQDQMASAKARGLGGCVPVTIQRIPSVKAAQH